MSLSSNLLCRTVPQIKATTDGPSMVSTPRKTDESAPVEVARHLTARRRVRTGV